MCFRGVPTRVPLPSLAQQVAAGSHHTVILLANGQVLTCGNFKVGVWSFNDCTNLIQGSTVSILVSLIK